MLALVVEAVTALLIMRDPQQHARIMPVLIGLGVTVMLCGLSVLPVLNLKAFQRTVIALITAWMFGHLVSLIITHRPVTSGMLLHMVMLALLAFSWLPARWAVGTILTAYAALCVGAAFSTTPDVPGLLLLAFLLMLTWYLTLYGDTVQTERFQTRQMALLASTDPLTGLSNRRAGQERLEELAARWAHGRQSLAVLLLDLDHFKTINDLFGHARGDQVLVAVAHVLNELAGPEDVVVRWGGEEFLIVLSGEQAWQARAAGERILGAVRDLELRGIPSLSMSGGLAFLSEAVDVKDLVALADQRMYAAKAAGRDQVV